MSSPLMPTDETTPTEEIPPTKSQAEPVLSVRNLQVTFDGPTGPVRAVDGVTFDLRPAEVLAVVGESGSGKSVTAMTLLGLTRGQARSIDGEIWYGGRDLVKLSDAELRPIRGSRIAMVFQDPMTSLNPTKTVGRQIVDVLRLHLDLRPKQARARAVELLAEVGISSPDRRVEDYPHQFSGGMRQRVMIAMALACEPEILIADEPTTALDVTIQAQVLALLRQLRETRGTAIVLITHDLGIVADVADRVAVMYAGKVVEQADRDRVFYHPQHPYTWGILASVPRIDLDRIDRLTAIPGSPPQLDQLPTGCAFRLRCTVEIDRCTEQPPLLPRSQPGHVDACWREPAERPALRHLLLGGRV
ncbi:ABC transporter ATP-binding protein [uncultured Friedmanniella sp.]|uniref:ABC transporter ATP-binding protein n=1 Tax=uncultured Friedmanniella sp. TaxID=335381 RepID=UPI0035CC31C5